jgi:hypothetical protein
MSHPYATKSIRKIRIWLTIFILGLVLSGVTAFPLVHELHFTLHVAASLHLKDHAPALTDWLTRVSNALDDTGARYLFLAYGTDWLAFGHLVLAVAFLGLWNDPVRNRWLVTFGLIACCGVLPLALIAGPIRGIPILWRLIDCSFGVFGCIPLLLIRRYIQKIEVNAMDGGNV